MDQGQKPALLQAMCQSMIATGGDSAGEDPVGHLPGGVIPGEYIYGWHTNHGSNHKQNPTTLVPVSERPTLTLINFQNPEMNPVKSGWYELVTPPTCQGCLALEDRQKKEWSCGGCGTTFKSKYEAKRHIDTAGMEVRCRYCDGVVNGVTFVLKRHVEESSRCLCRWKEQGFTGERTVDGAFRA